MRLLTLIFCLIAGPIAATAGGLMTADEFDAYTRDKTFYYGKQGRFYGAEEYLSNRRVVWSFLDGECLDGSWYAEGDHICFVYEKMPDPRCWTFERSTDGLIGHSKDDPGSSAVYEVRKSHEPLLCPGPEVGV